MSGFEFLLLIAVATVVLTWLLANNGGGMA